MARWKCHDIRIYIVFAMHSAITAFGVNSVHWLERKITFGWKFQFIFFHLVARACRHSSFFDRQKNYVIVFVVSLLIISSNSHGIPVREKNQRDFSGFFSVVNASRTISVRPKSHTKTISHHQIDRFYNRKYGRILSSWFYIVFLEILLI